jgi:hypothetical protein
MRANADLNSRRAAAVIWSNSAALNDCVRLRGRSSRRANASATGPDCSRPSSRSRRVTEVNNVKPPSSVTTASCHTSISPAVTSSRSRGARSRPDTKTANACTWRQYSDELACTLHRCATQRAANNAASDRCIGSATGSVPKSYSQARPALL